MSVKILSKKRNIPISRITEAYTLGVKAKTDPAQHAYFKASFESLEASYEKFQKIHNEVIGLLETDEDFETHDAIRKDTDTFYFKTKALYSEIFLDNLNEQGTSQNLVTAGSHTQYREVKLPKLTVPTFDGDLSKWPMFYDVYRQLIHENHSLQPIQKYQYLLSFLEGESLNLLRSIQTVGSNYEIAFETLTNRYQNKRILATNYWNAIVNAPTLKTSLAKDLRNLLDTFSENVASLEILNFPVKQWCFVLFNILLQKLDTATRTSFEVEYSKTELPTFENLKDFLNNHCRALESVQYMPSQTALINKNLKTTNSGPNLSKNNSYFQNNSKPNSTSTFIASTPMPVKSPQHNTTLSNTYSQTINRSTQNKCRLCNNQSHPLSQCSVFISKSPKDRFTYIKQQNACLNCLRFNHLLKDCPSSFNCRICRYRHHTMLHLPQTSDSYRSNNNSTQNTNFVQPINRNLALPHNSPQNNIAQELSQTSNQNSLTQNNSSLNCGCTALSISTSRTTVLLSTTTVEVLDVRGNYQPIRVILDSASQANFISQNCLNRLGLPRKGQSISILGLNQSSSITKGMASCTIRPVGQCEPSFSFDVLVVPQLCSNMPSVKIDPRSWSHIANLNLGDKKFHIPAPVDMLLGADIYSQILKSGRLLGPQGQPNAFETVFGWVLLGKVQDICSQPSAVESYFTSLDPPLELSIRRFWELEAIAPKVYLSPEDQKCEKIYKNTTIREKSGRFVVALPFRHAEPDLGDTYALAYRCFMSLESKLLRKPDLYALYSDFMKDYIKNGHMSLISKDEPKPTLLSYLPHLGVVTPNKATTKLRVVFNASAKGSRGISLNDSLLTGPKLQSDITEILLKFRFYPVVFLADIKQMYLQILVNPSHRRFQRLLWRFNPDEPLQEYQLNCVTFGVSSSPYLAIRTLRELAALEQKNYPKASQVLLDNIFMDDICAGSSTLEEALALQKDLIALLKKAGFELRKWASSNSKLLANLSPSDCQMPISFDKEEPTSIKVLGLQWNPTVDTFSFSYSPSDKSCTKRNILSEIARIYDPLGFLSPVSFLAKHIMQRLWISEIGWDDSPSQAIIDLWCQFKNELSNISKISLPRHIFDNKIQRCQILGFCDASEIGYACAVYLRLELPNDVVKCSLVMGKSKVSPLRTITLPRLELLGATLLADLLQFVLRSYSSLVTIDKIFAFSDSQVVLAWLSSSPHKWKNFIANRVAHVQETLPNVPWFYVPSLENPADCASRGLTPKNLVTHPMWFHGPPWIKLPQTEWKLQKFSSQEANLPELFQEEKTLTLSVVIEDNLLDNLVENISSLLKIQRLLSYCLRFIYNIKNKDKKLFTSFSSLELHKSLLVLVKRVQEQNFSELISQIKNNELLPKPLRKLAPFLDNEGFVRVGGRLRHSELSFEAKHPLLLPRNHRLTDLLIEQIHKQNLHPGLNTVQYLLRQQFWVLSSRRAIQKVLSKCIRCFRLKPKTYTPYMGDLPSFRTSRLKCFSHVTLDYAGPLKITMGRYRGAKVFKAYVCIFVCCATKALHIELVSDLTTDAFVAALRRFVARRGNCTQIWSDVGSNFVGASRQLQELSKVASESLHIIWHFNPPAAPHFNGLSEAGVKSVKTHLYRVIGDQILTFEELSTLLSQIEALLNSRPLCEQSSDPNDLSPLTPGHFLTMEPLNSCPDPDLSHLKLNTLSRWQLVQRLHSDFWKRWKSEYLNTLQQRSKWTQPTAEIKVNTLVLIKDETRPPLHWSLGRIVALHPGQDKHVRVVTVKTQNGLFKRPVVKLCPLPMD